MVRASPAGRVMIAYRVACLARSTSRPAGGYSRTQRVVGSARGAGR